MGRRGKFKCSELRLLADMFASDHLDKEDEEQDDEGLYGGKFDFVPRYVHCFVFARDEYNYNDD